MEKVQKIGGVYCKLCVIILGRLAPKKLKRQKRLKAGRYDRDAD